MKSVVFRCDASASIGAGHVMRCLSLAAAFARRGWSCTFAVLRGGVGVAPALAMSGHRILELAEDCDDATLLAKVCAGADLLVVDHYDCDVAYERRQRSWAKRILVLDDGTGRTHDCDALLDSAARNESDYRPLVPSHATLFLGPSFGLVSPRFLAARASSLARREGDEPVSSILISFGATDPTGTTAPALRLLEGLLPDAELVVAMTSSAPGKDDVRALCGRSTRLILDPPDMAQLTSSADVAIGGSGSSCFERAVLGVPSVTVQVADNQRGLHALFVEAGATIGAPHPGGEGSADFVAAVKRLCSDRLARGRMTAVAARLVDGRGAERVVGAMA